MNPSTEPFGHGIICPFQRDGKGDFAHAGGGRLLTSDIGELLGIIGPVGVRGGEVPWRMEMGSNLQSLRHRRTHSELVRATAEAMTAGVIKKYEPRVRAGASTAEPGDDGQSIQVRLSYQPVGSQQSAVFYELPVKE